MNAADRTWGSRFHRESIKLPRKIYRALAAKKTDEENEKDRRG